MTSSTSIYHHYAIIVPENFVPTRLYIKAITVPSGKRIYYFGKYTSTIKPIEDYKGSGIRWVKILKKYKLHPETLWVSEWYTDPKELQEVAIGFSIENNIVQSDSWANLKIENGLDGGIKIAKSTECTCKECGVLYCRYRYGNKKYCSKECGIKSRSRQRTKIRKTVLCKYCKVGECGHENIFCSIKCAKKYKYENETQEQREKRIERVRKTTRLAEFHWTKLGNEHGMKGRTHSVEAKEKMKANHTKFLYNAIMPSGEIIENISIPELCRKYKLSGDALHRFRGGGKIPPPRVNPTTSIERTNTTGWGIIPV